MKKIYYHDNVPIEQELEHAVSVCSDEREVKSVVLMYTLHKGGLIEAGIPTMFFDAAFDALLEAEKIVDKLKKKQKKIA